MTTPTAGRSESSEPPTPSTPETASSSFDLAGSAPNGAFYGLLLFLLQQIHPRSVLRSNAVATLFMATISAGNHLSRVVTPMIILATVLCSASGCGQPGPTVEPAPFEAAVERYVSERNMAMRLKQIREGPDVNGNSATMTASMTHRELRTPSVVWTFQFEKRGEDTWRVVGHTD